MNCLSLSAGEFSEADQNTYLETYITNETGFYNFLRAVAARTGQLLNYEDLARDADINHKTVKDWLNILETSGIIYLLRPYHNNVVNRLIKTPKLYFLDTGLCSYLTRWQSVESLEAGAMAQLREKYDLIYCRFLLHHLHSPRNTIKILYENLVNKGIYVGEEGIISHMFAYPPTFAWQGYMPTLVPPEREREGKGRDGDIGIKLFYECRKIGFDIIDCGLIQPILWKESQKIKLLEALNAYKKTDLELGTTEDEWQKKYDETVKFSKDDNQIIGFYGSFQVACRK